MLSRAAVFFSVLVTSLAHPAFPYVWAAPAEPPQALSNAASRPTEQAPGAALGTGLSDWVQRARDAAPPRFRGSER